MPKKASPPLVTDNQEVAGDGAGSGALAYPYNQVPADADLAHIAPGLRALAVPVVLLAPDPVNPRTHDERNLKAIRDSLRRFGQDQPLVVQRDGLVVRKGNGRLEAAKAIGWEYMAAVVLDEETMQAVERGIADNRSGELAKWDYETLAALMTNIKEAGGNLNELGWEPHEFEPLLQAEWKPPPDPAEDPKPKPANGSSGEGEPLEWGKPIALTAPQRITVDAALSVLRQQCEQPQMAEGRAIELICADYLSGVARGVDRGESPTA
jgi:hypothetical protein